MDFDKEPKKHPAYGHAVFCRTQGHIKLFASPMDHHREFITLKISKSELRHDLSRDWRFPTDTLIEVAFSSAQFAQLLTTMNVGEGAPCTIQFIKGEGSIERIPEEEATESERIKEGFASDIKGVLKLIRTYRKNIEAILEKRNIGKGDRETIQSALQQIQQHVECNWPFVVEQFQRATTKVETAAKAELDFTPQVDPV